jgi:hypothetical protein
VKDGGEKAAAKRLAELLKKKTKTLAEYWDRLQVIKGGCPIQSCCTKEDLHSTLTGGKTVSKNFTHVNKTLREPEGKSHLLNFNESKNGDDSENGNESENRNGVVVWSEETKEHGHVCHAAVDNGSGGVNFYKVANKEWPRKATNR